MNEAAAWAESFFTGSFVELWLRAMPEEQTRAEADGLEKLLRLPCGARVLDVPCGGGRHSLELAGRGYQMTGVDISDEFLAHARRAAERRLPIAWEKRPMDDLPWEGQFDGAFCAGNSLGGLDDETTAAFFRAVARALKPGARFVVDNGCIAECALPLLKERFWMPVGDILFLIHNHYDHERGRLDMEFTFVRDGKAEKKSGFQRVFTYREFCAALGEAGFEGMQGYASYAMEPFRLGSHNLVMVATRRAT